MPPRSVLALMVTAAAVLTAGLVGVAVVAGDDEPQGVAGLASCRTGPAAEAEPRFDELPAWLADALTESVPAGARCRELSFAGSGDELVAVHLRVEGDGWGLGIDAERLGAGGADGYRSLLPFSLADIEGGAFRAEGQGGTLYAFPQRDDATWALSIVGEGDGAEPVAVLARLRASWGR